MALPEPKRTIAECNAMMTAPGGLFELEEVQAEGLTLRSYKNLPQSLRDFWLSTKEPGGKRDYLVYQNERYTYKQAHARVLEIAAMLKERFGCTKGTRVAIASRNYPEWVFAFWAVHLLGGVTVAVNAWVTPDVLEHCIAFAESRIAIVDVERARALEKAGAVDRLAKGGVAAVLVVRAQGGGEVPQGMTSFSTELASFSGSHAVPECEVKPDDIGTIFYTSGTTGLPKGVVGNQRNFLTNIFNVLNGPIRATLRRGDLPTIGDPNAAQKVGLLAVPLFHVTGCHSVLAVYTALAGKVVILHKWSIDSAVDAIVQENVTTAGGMPFMAIELVNSALAGKDHSLELISYGGGPASKTLASSIHRSMGKQTWPSQGYGTTELSSTACNFEGEDYMRRPTSCGLPSLVNDFKVVSVETDEEVPRGKTGEILIKGINRTLGYLKNEKATKESFMADGYYRTGDIGVMDEEGFIYIMDRVKDLIIRGGENIASVTVENALYEADSRIADVAVTPIPDEKLGELVGATIVTHPQHHGTLSEAELIAEVAKRVPRHAVPVMVDIRTETLPRNGAGKTLKRELKHDLARLWEERKKGGVRHGIKERL